jgi:hypothetical protein
MSDAGTRLQKLNRRLSEQGLGTVPGWAANWAYWNGQLYRLPGAPQLRAEIKARKARKKFGIDTPIIVFQMGKVGSSSVYDALRDLDLDVPVYHAHVLNRFDVYAEGIRRTQVSHENSLAVLEQGRALRRLVDSGRWKCWSLVSLVRAPIPRSISGFFENLESFVPDFRSRFERQAISVAELIDTFLHHHRDYSIIHWFDDQVRDVFGIDVFAAPFPHAQGYARYHNDRARLLLMRLEDLNHCVGAAMCDFMGLERLPLQRRNSGMDKPYADLYRRFVEELVLPSAYIQEMHSTRYARQFYTPAELEASIAGWKHLPGEV